MPCGHFLHNGCSFSFCWHSSPVPTSVTSLKADISSQCSDAAPQFEAVPHCWVYGADKQGRAVGNSCHVT